MAQFKFLSKNKINSLPKTTGVYAFTDGKKFLYIGKAVNIRERVKNHFQGPSFKDEVFLKKADKIGYIETNSEIEALLLEAELIKKYQSKYNVEWRDDKNYFYIEITKEEFPRVFITHQLSPHLLPSPKGRGESKRGVGTNYFGPFVDGKAVKQTLKILRRIFPHRICKTLPKKKCLFYDLRLCQAPCAEEITKNEYRKNIDNLIKVLRGKKQQVLSGLKKEMAEAAKDEEFEKAAKLRDQIMALENVLNHSHILEGVKLLSSRKEFNSFLGIKTKIERIEGYDVSNIQGQQATGSMVVFEQGMPNKNEYRKFHIKIEGKPNDVAMLEEVLARRLNHLEWPLPQVILIDGGKAQINIARLTLKQFNPEGQAYGAGNLTIKVIALAKRKNELFVEGRKQPVLLKSLPREVSNLILQIRDEAHRFAVAYHKTLRTKDFLR